MPRGILNGLRPLGCLTLVLTMAVCTREGPASRVDTVIIPSRVDTVGGSTDTVGTRGRATGTVDSWNDAKGYGLIAPDSGPKVFVHHSAIVDTGFKTLTQGERVEFTRVQGAKGPTALEVKRLGRPR